MLSVLVSACTSTRLEQAIPEATGQPPEQAPTASALPQITAEERDAHLAEIAAARAGQSPAGRTRVELSAAELRAIANRHGDQALKEIEGE